MKIRFLLLSFLLVNFNISIKAQINSFHDLFELTTEIKSRSISFENPSGEKGQGGKSSSHLGIGRKGFASKQIDPGEKVVLCDIQGSGTIRHIWMTGGWKDNLKLLRTTIIRAYWDGQTYPSIECPLGDFMGLAHGKLMPYQSSLHSVGENAALNNWIPMPFLSKATITLTNESGIPFTLFYQIDYTINDKHKEDVGRLHTCFRRENPTTAKKDFELLPKRTGKGRFIGTVMGVRSLYPHWWGEGEIKVYLDGDADFPTICGTGSEDYIGLSYGIQQTSYLYHGCNLYFKSDSVSKVKDYFSNEVKEFKQEYISMYRWHILDPIYWEKDCRVTIQQMGYTRLVENGFFEREDDWSCATFWYEPVPSEPLPALLSPAKRIEGLDELYTLEK